MRTKEQVIEFWLSQATDDWEVVSALVNAKKYLQALFFAHLVIEKICKAIWIKNNETSFPPRTHNLIYILSQTPISLSEEQNEFLLKLNRFQLEGRYPEYLNQMHKICNETFTKETIKTVNELRQCLLNKLQ